MRWFLLGILLVSVNALELPQEFSATKTVTALSDSGPGSLREAMSEAQASGTPTKIVSTVRGMLTVTSSFPVIVVPLWLDLPGVVVSGSVTSALFKVTSAASTRISGMTISNLHVEADGALIVNSGKLQLENCALRDSFNYGGSGGAVFNNGDLLVTNCTIVGNQAGAATSPTGANRRPEGRGGGIYHETGTLGVFDSIILSNRVLAGWNFDVLPYYYGSSQGAGVYIGDGRVVLNRVSICANVHLNPEYHHPHGNGGGVWINGGEAFLTNCTVAQNVASGMASYGLSLGGGAVSFVPAGSAEGGGILVAGGSLVAIHTTIAQNKAVGGPALTRHGPTADGRGSGGGLYILPTARLVKLQGCVIADNEATYAPDIHGSFASGGANVFGDSSGTILLDPRDTGNATNILLPSQTGSSGQRFYDLPAKSAARDVVREAIADLDILRSNRPTGDFSDAGSYEGRAIAPTITIQPPETVTVTPLADAQVQVTAEGTPQLTYQLTRSNVTVRSSTEGRFVMTGADLAGTYRIAVSNTAGTATSRPFQFAVSEVPMFSEQPRSQSVIFGSSVQLKAMLNSRLPVAYRWFKDGKVIEGATNQVLQVLANRVQDLGNYSVEAISGDFAIESPHAKLALPQPVYVSSQVDTGPGSLRGALEMAAGDPGRLSLIVITNAGTLSLSAPLVVRSHVIVSNAGAGFTISGLGTTRILEVRASAKATFHNLKFMDGLVGAAQHGGAIWNDGSLHLTRCVFTRNSASFGGAIYNRGNLIIDQSTLHANRAVGEKGEDGMGPGGGGAGLGGAIYSSAGAVLLSNVTLSDNLARGGDGGWTNKSGLPGRGGNTISRMMRHPFAGGGSGNYTEPHPSFPVLTGQAGNPAGFGGGGGGSLPPEYGFQSGTAGGFGGGSGLPAEQSSLGGGGGGIGGSIFVQGGSLELHHCTIAGNRALGGSGGEPGNGVSAGVFIYSGEARIGNTILSGNSADEWPDFFGKIESLGGNLISSPLPVGRTALDTINADPGLEALSETDGLPVLRPLSGSPAIDRALPAPATIMDQLGRPRHRGEGADVGAVENAAPAKLSVAIKTVGSGTASVSPPGPYYTPGEMVTVRAEAFPGSSFLYWAGDLEGTNATLNLTLERSKRIEAVFTSDPLLVETRGAGSVEIVPDLAAFAAGEVVRLNPVAPTGWKFTHWSGDAEGNAVPYVLEHVERRSITANFAPHDPFRFPPSLELTNEAWVSMATFASSGQPFYTVATAAETKIYKLEGSGESILVTSFSPPGIWSTDLAAATDGTIAVTDRTNLFVFQPFGDQLLRFNPPNRFEFSSRQRLSAGRYIWALSSSDTNHAIHTFAPEDGQQISFTQISQRRGKWARNTWGARVAVSLHGELDGQQYVLFKLIEHAPFYVRLGETEEFLVLSSCVAVLEGNGAVARTIHLPPALFPNEVFPTRTGLYCSGRAFGASPGAYPGSPEIDDRFFAARLNLNGEIEWIHFLSVVPRGNPYDDVLTSGITAGGQSFHLVVGYPKFTLMGKEFAPGESGPTYLFEFNQTGGLEELWLTPNRISKEAVIGGIKSSFLAISAQFIFRGGEGSVDYASPRLGAANGAAGVDFRWRTNNVPWELERAPSLDPGERWEPFPVTPRIRGDYYVLPNKAGREQEFFRLRLPD